MGGRIIVESVAGCLWNRWPDGRGIRTREAIQAQRYSVLAAQYGVSIELIQKVFRTVIDEVVANHQAIRESTLK